MKRLAFITSFLLLLSPSSILFASTNVPAVLSGDTQWVQSGSPYILQGKVVVPSGAALHVSRGVQVIFTGASALEVNGTLDVKGSAPAPAVFNMIEGGLQSQLVINGGEADLVNAKVVSGVFLVRDSKFSMEGCEVTKGSGVYLQGSTLARLKNNKIYGNSTGVVVDGLVKAYLYFNTIVQNSYGLYLKGFAELDAKNNSIHDNQKEVVNKTPAFKMGGNFWGTDDPSAVASRIQGPVDVKPMKSLKDILRTYVRTQLPVITKQMSISLAAKERREEEAQKLALKKFKQGTAPAPQETTPAPAAPSAPELPITAEAPAPAAEEAPAPSAPVVEVQSGPAKSASVKSLPAAPHTLKPMANLPPDQGNVSETAASVPPASAPGENPAAPAPPALTDNLAPPALTDDIGMPPAVDSGTASSSVPPPPEVSSAGAPPPASDNLTPPDLETTAPPAVATSPAPPTPASSTASADSVPPPPDLNEQVPSTSVAAPPPVPASTENTSQTMPPQASEPAPPPRSTEPTESEKTAVQSLQGISGDIDGMQAPPLDLGLDLNYPSNSQWSEEKVPASSDTKKKKETLSESDLALPPLQDTEVTPPKDLELPPTDDLGNINLDSRSK